MQEILIRERLKNDIGKLFYFKILSSLTNSLQGVAFKSRRFIFPFASFFPFSPRVLPSFRDVPSGDATALHTTPIRNGEACNSARYVALVVLVAQLSLGLASGL